jgi:hypothetical protein
VEDEHGRFGWGAPEDQEVHSYINQLVSSVGAGKRFFPDRVRLKLESVNERRFRHGVVVLRYAVRG